MSAARLELIQKGSSDMQRRVLHCALSGRWESWRQHQSDVLVQGPLVCQTSHNTRFTVEGAYNADSVSCLGPVGSGSVRGCPPAALEHGVIDSFLI